MINTRLRELMDQLLSNLSAAKHKDYKPHYTGKFFKRAPVQKQTIFKKSLLDKNCSKATPIYRSDKDIIAMPDINLYDSTQAFVHDMIHELSHWTGHPDRCPRLTMIYDREEVVAELSAHITSMYIDLDFDKDSSYIYILGWLKYDVIPTNMISDALIAAEYLIDQMAEGYIFEPDHNPLRLKK